MNETLGERLAEARNSSGLNQSQAAKQIGVQAQTLSGYESGYREPSYDILLKLASLYHVTTDYLLGLEKKKAIEVEGLTDDELNAFKTLISDLAEKNAKLTKSRK